MFNRILKAGSYRPAILFAAVSCVLLFRTTFNHRTVRWNAAAATPTHSTQIAFALSSEHLDRATLGRNGCGG